MRAIDADALKQEFPKDTDWEYPVNTNSYVCAIIDSQPSIEPERLRLERILKKASIHRYGNDVRCTILDHALDRTFGYKFCPMCGTRLIARIEKRKGRKNEVDNRSREH